ncbi:MAG: aminoacyl-tRNA hydrolase [Oligoflexia bacterium]|nr:aminoacyl-tRNA hydrolase [Oligoflexia bacterium]
MYLLVGLGNPGSRYAQTRHNAGFVVVDYLFDIFKGKQEKQEKDYGTASVDINGSGCVLLKPLTFMNLSGRVVKKLLDELRYKDKDFDPARQLFVIHDDVDISPGVVKVKLGGSSGGHNGVDDIISLIGENFLRLRIGVGRPDPRVDTSDYVLQKFAKDEWENLVTGVCPRIGNFFHEYVAHGLNRARNVLAA